MGKAKVEFKLVELHPTHACRVDMHGMQDEIVTHHFNRYVVAMNMRQSSDGKVEVNTNNHRLFSKNSNTMHGYRDALKMQKQQLHWDRLNRRI